MDKYEMFHQNDIDNAYADGMEEGRKEGIEAGRAKGEEEILRLIDAAWDNYDAGCTPEEIAVKLGEDISIVKRILRLL